MLGESVWSVSDAHFRILFQIGSRNLRPPIFTVYGHESCFPRSVANIGSRNLRPPIRQFLFRQLEHEIFGETSCAADSEISRSRVIAGVMNTQKKGARNGKRENERFVGWDPIGGVVFARHCGDYGKITRRRESSAVNSHLADIDSVSQKKDTEETPPRPRD